MGLFGSMFKKNDLGHKRSPEVEHIFKKISLFMEDEAAQNQKCPPRLQKMMADGGAIDRWENAVGEFGRDISNPIPVNGPIGELVYLSSIATSAGCHVIAHRLGSAEKMDVYETVTMDGSRWDLLYFDMYHTRKSKHVPSGYQLSEITFLLATNKSVVQFPMGMVDALNESSQQIIGVPLVDPQLREDKIFRGFSRPMGHLLALESLKLKYNANWSQ